MEDLMRSTRWGLFAAATAALAFSASPVAAAEIDSSTGTGFVGKGDVQSAFGWNNTALNTNAGDVSFLLADVTTTTQSCVDRDKGEIIDTADTVVLERILASAVEYDTRSSGRSMNVTGFLLLGADTRVEVISNVVASCPDGYTPNGAPDIDTSTSLLVSYDGARVTIWSE
jgi:hypothetical protein